MRTSDVIDRQGLALRPPAARGYLAACLIAAAIFAAYMLIAGQSTLWDRDEPRYARTAVEMIDSGDYLVPTFNRKLFTDKPPLFYWLSALAIGAFGNSEAALRMFSAVGLAGACLLTYFTARRLFGPGEGIWSMLILASAPLSVIVGTMALCDGVMLFFITLCMAVFADAAVRGRTGVWRTLALSVGLGGVALTKGPLVIVPLAAILCTLLLAARGAIARPGRIAMMTLAAGLAGGLMFLAWAWPADAASGGRLLFGEDGFIGKHVLRRATQPLEGHGGNWLLFLPAYVPVVIAGFFPWVMYLPATASATLGGRLAGRLGRAFILGWTVPAFVMMSVAGTKLPHYVHPIWPAMSIGLAAVLAGLRRQSLSERDVRWLDRGRWLMGPIGLITAIGVGILPFVVNLATDLALPYWPSLLAATVLLAGTIWPLRACAAGQHQVAARRMLAGVVAGYAVLAGAVLPGLERLKLAPAMAAAINAQLPGDAPVAVYKFREPTLDFYLHRDRLTALRGLDEVRAWLAEPAPRALIIQEEHLQAVLKGRQPELPPLRTIATHQGFNYSNGRVMRLAAVVTGEQP